MTTLNRLHNCTNPNQGTAKKVLCLCSAGLLRSPTAALVLSQEPFNYNTRAAGVTKEYALIPVDDVLLSWADEIVVVEAWMSRYTGDFAHKVIALDIPDMFQYRSPALMMLIKEQYMDIISYGKVQDTESA